MQEPLDHDLARLFDEARVQLPAQNFLEQVETRIGRARRVRLALQIGGVALVTAVAIAVTPYVAEGSLAAGHYASEWLRRFPSVLASPAGWVCSGAVGLWMLRRSHVLGS